MARIRTIKPDFFLNDSLSELPPLDRILFVGLWTQADREGRLEDRPKRLKAALLPFDKYDVEVSLERLNERGFIYRYTLEHKNYIQIVSFLKHQLPNHKEPPSEIPAPNGDVVFYLPYPNERSRREVYERDTYICLYCGENLQNEPRKICLDHIIPLSQNGSNSKNNLATSCKRCNARKTNKNPEQAGMQWPDGLGEQNTVNPTVNPTVNLPLTDCQQGKERKGKERKDICPSAFEVFYKEYPKKIAKPKALQAWEKLAPTNGTVEAIMSGLSKWKLSPDWTKDNGQFVPHPATWLNQRRWEDEIPEPKKKWNEE